MNPISIFSSNNVNANFLNEKYTAPLKDVPEVSLLDIQPHIRFQQFEIVVNVTVEFKSNNDQDMQNTWNALKKCCNMLDQLAAPDVSIYVVIGLNCSKEKHEITIVKKAAAQFEENLDQQRFLFNHLTVTASTWTPAKRQINYVEFRNQLFYSEENQKAIQHALKRAENIPKSTVRTLFLDIDTEISPENLATLKDHWQKKDAASITCGIYHFQISNPQRFSQLELIGAEVENQFDRALKKLISQTSRTIQIGYKQLNIGTLVKENPSNKLHDLVASIISRNILVLGSIHSPTQAIVDGLSAYRSLKEEIQITTRKVQKPITFQQMEIKGIKKCLERIAKIETEFGEIATPYSIFGKDLLYVSENATALSLYENDGLDTTVKLWDAHESMRKIKKEKFQLWGTQPGRGEGENFAIQVRRMSKHYSNRNRLNRPVLNRSVVDFPWTFTTEMPERNRLSNTTDIMLRCYFKRGLVQKIVSTLFHSFLHKSQSSLSDNFLIQRIGFAKGTTVFEPKAAYKGIGKSGYSPFPRGVRDDVAQVIQAWIPAEQEKMRALAKAELERRVRDLFAKPKINLFDHFIKLISTGIDPVISLGIAIQVDQVYGVEIPEIIADYYLN